MKIITIKFKIIFGTILFIILLGAYYSASILVTTNNNEDDVNNDKTIGEIVIFGEMILPIENFQVVTSEYGTRINPITNIESFHTGIDLVGSINSNILSIDDGKVSFAGWNSIYGYCIEIEHTDEYSNKYYSFYAHMQENSLTVIEEENVEKAQIIGIQGTTGNSTRRSFAF